MLVATKIVAPWYADFVHPLSPAETDAHPAKARFTMAQYAEPVVNRWVLSRNR